MAMRLHRRHEIVARGACDRLFAGRIDIGDDDDIGIVETGGEFVEERGEARIAMRLHDGDDLVFRRSARGAQHRGDLHRMVSVIVEDRRTVPLAGAREAPLDAAERGERLADRFHLDAELVWRPRWPPSH